MTSLRKAIAVICAAIMIYAVPMPAVAQAVSISPPVILAESFILYEPDRDMILYAKDETKRMYPASITKILTALLVEEHIAADELLIAGAEIKQIPADSSRARHEEGEALSRINLLRGLIIPSGNETANIVAMHIARQISGNYDISYRDAEALFSGVMNEKTKALGAEDTNFVNPHGYHAGAHYTTALDMARITKAALESELIMQIAMETEYIGPSALTDDPSLQITEHNWTAHNLLVQAGVAHYPYATGLKTGFTTPAGECLAATAEKDGRRLIAILFNVPKDMRWQDAQNLFDYGFEAFGEHTLQEAGEIIGRIDIQNPRLGDPQTMRYYAKDDCVVFVNKADQANIVQDIAIDRALLAPPVVDEETGETDDTPRITPPVERGAVVGSVAYSLNGEILYTGELLAAADVEARTFNTDADYYVTKFKSEAFTLSAIPYWFMGITVPVASIVFVVFLVRRGRQKNSGRYYFEKRGRRW